MYNPKYRETYKRYQKRRYREDPEFRERLKKASKRYYDSHKDDKEWRMQVCELARKRRIKRMSDEDKKIQAMVPGD